MIIICLKLNTTSRIKYVNGNFRNYLYNWHWLAYDY